MVRSMMNYASLPISLWGYVLLDPGAAHSFISSMFALHIDRMLESMPDELFISTIVGDVLVVREYYRNYEDKMLKPEDVPVVQEFLDVFLEELSGLLSDREVKFTIDLIPSTTPILQVAYRMAPPELKELKELKSVDVVLAVGQVGNLVASFQVRPTLVDDILREQLGDSDLQKIAKEVGKNQRTNYELRVDKGLLKEGRVCVHNALALKQAILEEAHSSAYAMHPGSTKMYRTLKKSYWWPGMKRETTEFVNKCLICQQVKPEWQRPTRLLNPLPVPEWK
ncbi:uncharacterized protein LOC120084921 [Benincasa hispida]|uniref:uncharacterized protein LOC120084921 n=1 Tax=Benincasa hispida TaxID=102211 RepID=UPI00190194B7|nr:uncharacterized protein LOC120084921 [Benincasa hispida]